MKHRTTDPACSYHRPPKGWLSRWRFDRARGRSCRICVPYDWADDPRLSAGEIQRRFDQLPPVG